MKNIKVPALPMDSTTGIVWRCKALILATLVLGYSLFGTFFLSTDAGAQTRKPQTISELVTYNGADRDALLYAGAKAEGKVVWYTSLAGESYKAMVKAFEAKYPGVKVEVYRASGSDLTTRMAEEAKAKRYIVDTVETTEANLMFMRDLFLIRPYHSPHLASYPADAKAKGAPVEWVAMDIVPTNVGGAAIAVQPPHPQAALLLADYLLGPEGQGILEKYEYGSASKQLGFKRWRPEQGSTTEKYEKDIEQWEKLLKQISRKGR